MTRKEMITACVDDQIKRGIINAENRALHINTHLKGKGYVKAMSKTECQKWYDVVFSGKNE